jgi:hypothetical protein
MMDTPDFLDLVAGYDPAWIAALLKIHPRTLKRWKEGTAAVPFAAFLLLKLKLEGDLATLAGKPWEGFQLRQGKLYLPYFKRGLEPMQICALFFEVQELRHLRREVQRLGAELKLQQSRAWALQKVNNLKTFYGADHADPISNNPDDHLDPDTT